MNQPYRPAPRNAEEAAIVRRAFKRRSIGAAFMYFGIYFGWQIAVGALYGIVLLITGLTSGEGLDPAALTAQASANSLLLTGISNLLTLITYWILFAARRCRFGLETQLKRPRFFALLLLIPLGFCCHVLVASALSFLPQEALESYAQSASFISGNDALSILCVALIAPFAEEIIFRGLLYTRLKRGLGRTLALLIASLLFGLMHGQLIWMVYAFLFGLLLSAMLEWYDSLWASILLHLSFNASQYVVEPLLGSLSPAALLACSAPLVIVLILLAWRCGKKRPLPL